MLYTDAARLVLAVVLFGLLGFIVIAILLSP